MASNQRDLLASAINGILASLASTGTNSNNQQTTPSTTATTNLSGHQQQSAEGSLSTLFPQCGQRSAGAVPRGPTSSEQHSIPKFDPRSGSNKRKRKQNKKTENKQYHFAKDIILKDVVLLPSPEHKNVPRGKLRETLYAEGYVASAIEIHSSWSEEDAVESLETIFYEKLKDIATPRYDISL